ncbi:MAG: PDZ domain-containing protein [Candidatus Eremiobacteraeota bacterium]|nr:PDZ domain-containing protein [Candidatus Eremiobacteraeota bacterium]MBC5826403.1 PDZ domain-containing protein [Candidatus Eremiobacteraeota bacterium]
MNDAGYLRYPAVSGDTVIFVCEDDLWAVGAGGGVARRLTAGAGECSMPRLSPDGNWLGYVAGDEAHPEVYVMPAAGGTARRLTFLGSQSCTVCCWMPAGDAIAFTSDARSPFLRHTEAYAVDRSSGAVKSLAVGEAVSIHVGADGAMALGRNNNDPARWKRYRGGTAGELWADPSGSGEFHRLSGVTGNPAWPMWVGARIFFLSDHEGSGNIYSCRPDASDIQRHTDHAEYYVRFPSTDGRRIVYTAGGSLYVLDTQSGRDLRLEVETPSGSAQRTRRFVEAADNLEHFAPHPEGHSLALIARGQPFTLPNWEEAMTHFGKGSAVRYRLAEWLPDGKRFAAVDDQTGAERVSLHWVDQLQAPQIVSETDLGRIIELRAAPVGELLALANHRHELLLLDPSTKTARVVDRSPGGRLGDLAWSGDGRWLAYSFPLMPDTSIIRIVEAQTGDVHDVTSALRVDSSPYFDPAGDYLYFLSTRDFNPVYDALQFDLSFPNAMRPFLATLRKDVPSPFVPKPRPFGNEKEKEAAIEPSHGAERVEIDFDGITDRIVGFPVEEGRYDQIVAAKGRALFTKHPVRGSLQIPMNPDDDFPASSLFAYDFSEQRQAVLAKDVGEIRIAGDHRTIVYQSGKKLRAIDALQDLPEEAEPREALPEAGRRSGWIDLGRISVEVTPAEEWGQMYREAWQLQRENFWDERMSRVDWDLVFDRYARLLPLLRTRGDLSDLIWEMQGELGTSHAYELGGDYRKAPQYQVGFLGADLEYDDPSGGFLITRILRGDSWDRDADSPLNEPGLGLCEGDVILAVGGRAVDREHAPQQLLVNAAGKEIVLTVRAGREAAAETQARRVVVKSLRDERALRYRAWVNDNRALVHNRTQGKVGYVHIPDMGPWGFAEFHRGYLSEFNRQGLIVDVRFNRGGHVSALLLEKLTRKRVGYDISRWGPPIPYPLESVAGPMVGLTNQFAGSDGDIFSHCFKLYGLGPLVGKRTWGGVVGIWPRHLLVDGTVTTQPEFSFWFTDVGWRVENYGTDPDVDVDILPQDYRAGRDPQLDKALELVMGALQSQPVRMPDFGARPDLSLPNHSPHAAQKAQMAARP